MSFFKPLGVISTWDAVERYWTAPGREPSYGGSDPTTKPFVIGTDMPTKDNTGAGTDGYEVPTEVIGSVQIQPGQVVENKIIDGWVSMFGGTLRNCIVLGGAFPTSGRPLVNVLVPDGWNGQPIAMVDHCTLQPKIDMRDQGWSVGIGIRGFVCTRTKILDCIDGLTISGGAYGPAVELSGSYVGDLVALRPDPWGFWPATHNDGIQFHGSTAYHPPSSAYFFGNTVDAFPSAWSNVPLPDIVDGSAEVSLACALISKPTGLFTSMLLDRNWFFNANQQLNAVADGVSAHIVAKGNRWTRGTADGGSPVDGLPYVAAYILRSYTTEWASDNVWHSGGQAAPIYRT